MPVPAWPLILYALPCCRWRWRCWSGSICGVMPCLANGLSSTSPACQVASEAGRCRAHPRNQAEKLGAARCSSAAPQQRGPKSTAPLQPTWHQDAQALPDTGFSLPRDGSRWRFPPLIQPAWESGILLGVFLVPPRDGPWLGANPSDWRPGRKRRRRMFLNHVIPFWKTAITPFWNETLSWMLGYSYWREAGFPPLSVIREHNSKLRSHTYDGLTEKCFDKMIFKGNTFSS